jgi:pimeloyl-ACP methyl ester carboxylesterase
MDGFDLARWQVPVAGLDPAIVGAGPRLLEIRGRVTPIHLLVDLRPGQPLVVSFVHRVKDRAASRPPYFAANRITGSLRCSRILVSDPGLHASPTLQLGWHTGGRLFDHTDDLRSALAEVAALSGAPRSLLFGVSGGGYAAMRHAAMFPDPTCMVVNPQTDIFAYKKEDVVPYLAAIHGSDLDDEPLRQRLRLNPAERPQQIVYLQNPTDWHVRKHMRPYFAASGLTEPAAEPGLDLSNAGAGVISYFGRTWEPGHHPPHPALTQAIMETWVAGASVADLLAGYGGQGA